METTGPMDEVCEVADAAGYEETGDRLVQKCHGFGMRVDFAGILGFVSRTHPCQGSQMSG